MMGNTFPATAQWSAPHSAGVTRQPCVACNSAQWIANNGLM